MGEVSRLSANQNLDFPCTTLATFLYFKTFQSYIHRFCTIKAYRRNTFFETMADTVETTT